MTREEALRSIAATIETLINTHGRRHDIIIKAHCCTEGPGTFSDWERKYFSIRPGDEYFMIYEHDSNNLEEPFRLLYTVNVSCDSILTATAELMDLASRKF